MRTVLLLIASILLFSCKSKEVNSEYTDSINFRDSMCAADIQKAKRDLLNGYIVYCEYESIIPSENYQIRKQIIDLLKKYKIDFQTHSVPCTEPNYDKMSCYYEFMNEQIKKLYGNKFIDSLITEAKYLQVTDTLPPDTFYHELVTFGPRYPGETVGIEFSEKLQNKINETVIYPKGYIYRELRNEDAYTNVTFIVNKEGKATNLAFRFVFDKSGNKAYENDLKKIITPFITDAEWQPATVGGKKVICDMKLRILLY